MEVKLHYVDATISHTMPQMKQYELIQSMSPWIRFSEWLISMNLLYSVANRLNLINPCEWPRTYRNTPALHWPLLQRKLPSSSRCHDNRVIIVSSHWHCTIRRSSSAIGQNQCGERVPGHVDVIALTLSILVVQRQGLKKAPPPPPIKEILYP